MTRSTQAIDLGVLIALAYGRMRQHLRAALAEEGFADLGRSDGYVFRALDAGTLTTSELAERLRITKQGAAQIVADMQRRGYVERRPDPTDRRAQPVRLSPRGEAALAAARRFHQRYERSLKRNYGAERIVEFREMLTAISGDGGPVDPDLRGLVL
jgi:DNA-binding MarR family transcriptional regulator